MKLMVIGATGLVGRRVVAEALARGHEVTALVRQPNPGLDFDDTLLRYEVGDALDPDSVDRAVTGHDAVISAVGGSSVDLRRRVAEVVTRSMEGANVRRLIGVGGAGILQLDEDRLRRDAAQFPRALQPVTADHHAVWQILEQSDLVWTLVCPPLVRDQGAAGSAIVATDTFPEGGLQHVGAGDIATFICDELAAGRHLRRRVGIAERA